MNDDPRLLSERNLWLATTRPNGKPHLVPIWFVWLDGHAFVCTPADSVKVRNLRANPRASLALEDGDRPAIAECTTRLVEKPFPAAVQQAFLEKFGWNISNEAGAYLLIELIPKKWLSWPTS